MRKMARKKDTFVTLETTAMASVFNVTAGLERLAQALRVLLWEQAQAHGLSPIQVQFLVYLKNHAKRDSRVSHLAKTFDLTKATVSDAVSTLEHKGYLERKPLREDKRAAVLMLTKAGETLAKELEPWADDVKAQLANLPKEKRLELMTSTMQLIASLQEAGVISLTRMCFTCQFFQKDKREHFCSLLNKPLPQQDLRIDCPEHQQKE
jgi:DNA-binding MarR family transcriptional regulator